MPDPHAEIAQLRNLGPRSAVMLNAVGIYTRADLEHIGPVMAYRMVQDLGYGSSLNLLYAMAGALQDAHWADLSPDQKARLREAVAAS